MAFWRRHKIKYVVVWSCESGKQKQLPRKLTKHLDGAEDHIIESWVSNYSYEHERKKDAPAPLTDVGLTALVERFRLYLKKKQKAYTTIQWHCSSLENNVIPFFLGRGLTDPAQWAGVSVHLLPFLEQKELTSHNIVKCNQALNQFWSWLTEEGLVHSTINLRTPIIVKAQTPLKFTQTPEEIMDWVRRNLDSETSFMACMGFFFSLRPQETFALRLKDFQFGLKASESEACKVMARHGLYDRVAVHIERQITKQNEIKAPKANSIGWVSCFHKEAAQWLSAYFKNLDSKDPSAPLFKCKPDRNFRRWAKIGIPDITLKYLRRSSVYWLGHYTDMGIQELANHARHENIETTRLYLRRPDEDIHYTRNFDLDA